MVIFENVTIPENKQYVKLFNRKLSYKNYLRSFTLHLRVPECLSTAVNVPSSVAITSILSSFSSASSYFGLSISYKILK